MRANWRFESPYAQYHSAEQQLQLFPLDTGIFNDLRPKSELSLDQFSELRRLARGRRHSLFVELLDNIRQGNRLCDFVAQLFCNRGRVFGGASNPK